MLFQMVEATYVEGSITQDTIWTLVDSPFVVLKNITVYSNATLTIEPGVEVRFGGPFSLTVSGKLHANGTEKAIKFTSNSEQPDAGDWNAIKFNGIEKSMLIGCFVAHATDGILVENGDVEIENTNISLCLQNGITAVNSTLTVQASTVSSCSLNGIDATNSELTVEDDVIMDNGGNGIVITGNEQVTIQRNTIISNGNGVLLTGNETSKVNINHNIISANEQNGIQINTVDHTNLAIIYNNISSNYMGLYISSPTSTYITNNSISYNDIGIFYDQGSHTAYFNDIYGNEKGMDVASNAIVNAEYNYWGRKSGPYHESLNPSGKGNPVGGDGVNLDFIFFLTEPFGYINARPIATLLTDKTIVPPNEMVMFFATNSFDEGRIDRYRFDFGDGENSGWTTLSIFVHEYSLNGTYHAYLTVMDDFGVTSDNTAETTINVQYLTSLQVSLISSSYTVDYGEEVSIAVQVTDGITAVGNATVTFLSINGGSSTPSSGLTNSTGHLTATFTAPSVTQTTNVRIVATASKTGYADGSDYEYLEVLPPLLVQVTADPAHIKSEETTTVTVHVTYREQPVAEALVTVSCDGGNLSATTGVTNSEGDALFSFSAPLSVTLLNVTITASAIKIGYTESVGQTTLTVEPKKLVVDVVADPTTLISEAVSHITVHVTYEGNPISNATVSISSDSGGNFSATTELTDSNGNATFILTAPQANAPLNLTITVTATKTGYADGEGRLQIVVYPGTLGVQVIADPATIESKGTSIVTVHVTCNATPVAEALVTVSCDGGNLSATTGVTNSSGYCEFIFNAPRTPVQLTAIIVANANKNGYIEGESQTTITVTQETGGGGWPLTTILLIIIPIVIVVIIVVLVKLKVITFSGEEES